MAAKKKNTEGLAFLVETLKKDRNATYADAKAAAEKKGLAVWPIMFGKAKLMLGYVKAGSGAAKQKAKRGPGRPPKAAAAMAAPKRGPGRPRKVVASGGGFAGLDGIVAAVRGSQQELERYRSAIERIQQVLASALS